MSGNDGQQEKLDVHFVKLSVIRSCYYNPSFYDIN